MIHHPFKEQTVRIKSDLHFHIHIHINKLLLPHFRTNKIQNIKLIDSNCIASYRKLWIRPMLSDLCFGRMWLVKQREGSFFAPGRIFCSGRSLQLLLIWYPGKRPRRFLLYQMISCLSITIKDIFCLRWLLNEHFIDLAVLAALAYSIITYF